eukprot:6914297-Pyramimonas_sp.AAC.1
MALAPLRALAGLSRFCASAAGTPAPCHMTREAIASLPQWLTPCASAMPHWQATLLASSQRVPLQQLLIRRPEASTCLRLASRQLGSATHMEAQQVAPADAAGAPA